MRTNWPAYNLLFAAVMWGLLWYPVRLLSQAGLPGLWSTLTMYASAVFVGLYLMRGHWQQLLQYPRRMLGIVLASGWCNTAFIVAIAEKDAARVVLLFHLAPVWTIVMGAIFLKERPESTALTVCGLAMTGAVFMLWNPDEGMLWPRDWVDWLALSSGFSFAILNILIRDLQQVSLTGKAFTSWLGVLIVALLWILFTQTDNQIDIAGLIPQVNYAVWFGAAVLGAVAIVTMTLAVQYGVTHLPLYKSSIILLVEVAVTVISTQFLSNDQMTIMAWLGGAFIMSASLVFALALERKTV